MAAKRTPSAAAPSEAVKPPRRRDRRRTQTELQLALNRLQRASRKVSIAAVAKEAGVTPALIHNTYPDFAEHIRALLNKSTRAQRDDKHQKLQLQRATTTRLYEVIADQNKQIVDLASVNEALRVEIRILKGIVEGKVLTAPFGRKTE
ncbi:MULTISPECIES: TetR family transcriptional regulator [Paraburkholderia]|uniref:TetR family transcriptional regulator n=1 Tax=Paraburkholderia madseniana TaxID=2599607 RepID=A0AAP5ETQ0_9BURK|nr:MULTISPECIES: TetR family transcriptional regulator [Paraburkholderia]MCX4151521.1 TetR family transcriptional regulator [Paraburkholderia madseniana]MDN7154452.1 TetR family transcriptional regulator [Paraburkholderia sp. WS6]MDQ6413334.1 TetR family transcriptional regulator [Paraburkholderia madseniana]